MVKIKLTFTGDIMLPGYTMKNYIQNKNYNFDIIFDGVREKLLASDYVVGNLETPISMNKSDYRYEKYRFTAPIEFAEAVKKGGINLVSTANNHCLDNGINGIKKTVDCLNNIGLDNIGISLNNDFIFYKTIDKVKFSFISSTYGTNAFSNNVYLKKENQYVNLHQKQEGSSKIRNWFYNNSFFVIRFIRKAAVKLKIIDCNLPIYERNESSFLYKKRIKKQIAFAKKNSDIVIFLLHDGGQFNEKPIKRIKKQINFLIKNGVDIIIGNHEHVVHPILRLKDNFICYSLGNFNSTYGVTEKPFDKKSEYSVLLNLIFDSEKKSLDNCYFNIIKSIEIDNKITVKLIDQLYDETHDKQILEDAKYLLEYIVGKKYSEEDIKKNIFYI